MQHYTPPAENVTVVHISSGSNGAGGAEDSLLDLVLTPGLPHALVVALAAGVWLFILRPRWRRPGDAPGSASGAAGEA